MNISKCTSECRGIKSNQTKDIQTKQPYCDSECHATEENILDTCKWVSFF